MFDNNLKRQLAAALAVLVFIVTLQAGALGSKKSSLKSQLGTLEKKIKNVKAKIAQKEGERRSVFSLLSATQRELEKQQTSLSQNKLSLLDANADLQATIARLERTMRQLDRRQDLLDTRIVDIYEGDDLSYLNVLLGSADMSTFLTRAYYLQRILDSDATLIQEIKADKLQIETDKARKARRYKDIASLQVRLQAERDRVASLADDRQAQLDAIENSKELYEKALEEFEAQSRAIEARIQAYQSTPQGRRMYARTFKGGLSLPCSGRFTSSFGYRRHPITGVYKLHTGVDIAVPKGTSVRAAADGVVMEAGWNDAYGYMVIIDHGGGVSTLCAHNSRLLCRAGQSVKRGDVIAKSGSTGYSTGPHVHFEKRVNGVPVNPN